MKKALLVLFAMGWFLGGFAQEIQFETVEYDFGNINFNYNDLAVYEFVLTNTGTEPLIIQKARAKHGYTYVSWPKEVMPGKKDCVKVEQRTNRPGTFSNSITVTSNAKNSPQKILKVKGCVWPEGIKVFKKNGYWGCEDDKGKVIVSYHYDQVVWGGNCIKLKKNGKWGVADETGVIVIPCEYDEEFRFEEAMSVKKGGKWGVIDNKNKVIIPFEYDNKEDVIKKNMSESNKTIE